MLLTPIQRKLLESKPQKRFPSEHVYQPRRRFELKFQQIVQDEQEGNFISRLHAGELEVIPWPVIQSERFYTLFDDIRMLLDQQVSTHGSAGVFLQTLKFMMAKLKVTLFDRILRFIIIR